MTLVPRGVTLVPCGVTLVPFGVTLVPYGPTLVPRGVSLVPRGVTLVPRGVTPVPCGVTLAPCGLSLAPCGVTLVPCGVALARRGCSTQDSQRPSEASSPSEAPTRGSSRDYADRPRTLSGSFWSVRVHPFGSVGHGFGLRGPQKCRIRIARSRRPFWGQSPATQKVAPGRPATFVFPRLPHFCPPP